MRQCPNRYAIRAGQNLPDKEFRYLRTVIVTAAVYWGFDSMLAHLLLTFQHRAGVSSYTSAFAFAETCVFDKQLPGPFHCGLLTEAPLLPKLRGQLAEFLNNPSPVGLRIFFLSTCVGLRYGLYLLSTQLFSPSSKSASRSFAVPYDRVNHRPARSFQSVPVLKLIEATEFLPYVHRLRVSASP